MPTPMFPMFVPVMFDGTIMSGTCDVPKNLNHPSKDVHGLAFCDFRVPVSNHTRRGSFWPALKSVSIETFESSI